MELRTHCSVATTLREKDAIRTHGAVRGCIRELVMAGRDFGGDAETRPVVHTNGKVCCAQNDEAKAGRISKSELESAGREFHRLGQQKWHRHGARGIEQFSGGTSITGVESTSDQNLAGWEQGREMVATPTNQWQGWQPFSRGRIEQLRAGKEDVASASRSENFPVGQQRPRRALARSVQSPGKLPGSARRIVQLR